jgi:hypothetical protein
MVSRGLHGVTDNCQHSQNCFFGCDTVKSSPMDEVGRRSVVQQSGAPGFMQNLAGKLSRSTVSVALPLHMDDLILL